MQFRTVFLLIVASVLAGDSSQFSDSPSRRNASRPHSVQFTGNWTQLWQDADADAGDRRSSYSATNDLHLSGSSMLYGLIVESASQRSRGSASDVGETCRRHLQSISGAIHQRDVWAMKMLDASATAQPGFVWGNNFWLGSRKQCESVQVRKQITLSPRFVRTMKPHLVDQQAPFEVGYRVIYAEHSSPWQVEAEFLISSRILHLGVCVPRSCSDRDIHQLAQANLDSDRMVSAQMFVHRSTVVQVKSLQLSPEFYAKTSLRIVGAFAIVTLLAVICGTLLEQRSTADALPSAWHRYLTCFSLRSNARSLASTTTSPNAIGTVNAFKAIGCLLILDFHVPWYSYFAVNNGAQVFVLGEEIQWQWLSTAPIIVDIFFAISGMLLAYNFLRNGRRMEEIRTNTFGQNARLFGKQLLHRYLRLTPLYLMVVGLTDISTSYLADTSPLWLTDRIDRTCSRNWLANVLYVQNFYPVREICVNWTWSLACEMQFFLVHLALLFVYAKHPRLAQRVFAAMFVALTVALVTIAWSLQFTVAYDVLHDLGRELYTVPWARALPYLIGVGCGWYLHASAGRALPLSAKTVRLGWTLAGSIMCVCHMVTFVRSIGYGWGVLMLLGVRIFYGAAACWMIVASAKGEGGRFARAMNSPIFVHVNKLSYGIYLLNPLVVSFVMGSNDQAAAVEPIVQMTFTMGITVIVYVMAVAFTLLFEIPYTKLSAEMLRNPTTTPVQQTAIVAKAKEA